MSVETQTLPVLPLRDVVVYPHMVIPLFVGREISIKALDKAMEGNKQILLIAQKSPTDDDPGENETYDVGTMANILQLLKLPDGTIKVLVEGTSRASVSNYREIESLYTEKSNLFFNCLTEKTKKSMFKWYRGNELLTPYNSVFGRGVYNNNSGNQFVIKNTQSSHAIVLLINAYSDRKIRNEFVRKGETFTMTGVPNGTYYMRWISGNDWSPDLIIGDLTGGFQSDLSFSQMSDSKDWMSVGVGNPSYYKWTLTLYSSPGGDVEFEKININQFIK